jgi:hypothetical protein
MKIALISATSAVLGGFVTAILTFTAQNIASSREHDARMVEIAIGILRAEPKPEIVGARTWAIRVINASSVPLTKGEEESLIKNAIPYVPSLDFSDPRNSQYIPLH